MPRINPNKTNSNFVRDNAWCPGCGLWAHMNGGVHRADCTAPDPKPEVSIK